ncbi:MAG: NAD(P)/FAD-dependent oxidoreductase [Rhodomicrobium sp.]
MVTMQQLPAKTDVFIVGGGPAGLVAALAARKKGLEVTLADGGQPPIDKACGEGLMPDGVEALRRLGVSLNAADGASFRGIRFLDQGLSVEALFPHAKCGIGLRRTRLHQILADAAESAGANAYWKTPVEALGADGVRVAGREVQCQWIIGADGLHSRIRRWSNLELAWSGARRIGIRQHFRVEPWTDLVEVYWNHHCQANVTPTGPDEICIAMIGTGKHVRVADLPGLFPALASHLRHAKPMGPPRGAITMSSRLSTVTDARIALIGDASGTVDAVTGEGMHLAFRQAEALAEALVSGDLRSYSIAHRRLRRMPQLMARLLLMLDGNDALRRAAFRSLRAFPPIFSALLAFHVGGLPAAKYSLARSEGLLGLPAFTRVLTRAGHVRQQ